MPRFRKLRRIKPQWQIVTQGLQRLQTLICFPGDAGRAYKANGCLKLEQGCLLLGRDGQRLVGAARITGQVDQSLQTLRALCADLPEGFDALELAEARQLLLTK